MKSIIIWLAVIACALVGSYKYMFDTQGTTELLKKNGYTDIVIHGYEYFGCDKNDVFHTAFTAKNSNGVVIDGLVCKGFMKGSTIRFKD